MIWVKMKTQVLFLGSFSLFMLILIIQFILNNSKKVIRLKDGGGTCSQRAFDAGYHQKVFSYAVYGDPSSQYWFGIPTNVLWIRKLFPGWFIRFYTDNPDPLKDLEREYPETVFVCDVRNLQLTEYPKMFWRFYPLGDEQIDVINIRDTDSIVRLTLKRTIISDVVLLSR